MKLSRLLGVLFFLIFSNVSFGQASLPVSRTAWGTTPTGWTDNGVNRTTSFACSGNDAGSMQATGRYYKVWYSGVADQLTYSIKGSNPTNGSFKVQESADDITWTDVTAYTTITGGTCISEVKSLLSTSRYVQFIYITKTSGNVDIDDVNITGPSCTQPTTQASAASASPISNFAGTINWSRGNGDNVLVVVRQGAAVATNPSSGTTYTANAAFGSGTAIGAGYVVYNGIGTSVPVTNLLENTTYHYAIYEYNNTGVCYKTPALTGSFTTTQCSPTTQANTFTSSSVTATTATVGWTRGNGNSVLVVARQGSAVNQDPTSGTTYTANSAFMSGQQIGTGNYVVYNGTGTSVGVTGLTPSTTYHFAIYEFNTALNCYHLTELTGNFTTPAAPAIVNITDIPSQVAAANVPQGTVDHVIYKIQMAVTTANATLTQFRIVTTGTYLGTDILNYKLRYSTDNVLDAGDTTISTLAASGVGTKTFTGLSQVITNGSTGYFFVTVDISGTAVLGRTIAVNAVPNSDIILTSTGGVTKVNSPSAPTACGTQTISLSPPAVPTSFTKGCTGNTTQVLSWAAPATGTFDGYLLVVRAGATPNAVTSIVASSQSFNLDYSLAPTYNATTSRVLYIGTGTTATVTGLTPGASYTFALYAYKNNGASSLYSTATTTTQTVVLANVTGVGSFAGNATGTIIWTNPSAACYDGVMAVVTTAPGITFAPTGNGSAYTANPVYSAPNQVVFRSTSSFVTITGLTNGVTYYVEIFVRKGTEWSSGVEVPVTPNISTVFKPGELVFVGFDGQINSSGPEDQYMVATMVDILPGTTFSIANSRYEAGAAANVRTNKWGGAGDDPSAAPGVTNITYNGSTNIAAGSVMVFNTNSSNAFSYAGVITGTTLTDRTSDFSFFEPYTNAPNISTANGDGEQIYLLQGNYVFDEVADANEANYYLVGTLLHGFTIKVGWVPFTSACSGVFAGGSVRQSRLPVELTCFNVESTVTNTISGYYENAAEHGSTSIRNIIIAISNVGTNWTLSNGRYTTDASSSASNRAGKTFIIGAGNPNGQWLGSSDTNWFNCSNWERLTVPDEYVDVIIDNTATNDAIIDYTAAYSDFFSDIATCKNLTINGRKLVAEASSNNKLEVYGDLTIGASGVLDMDDSSSVTADGQVYLSGNWTNNGTDANFLQGNSTVHFNGGGTQVINANVASNPEEFYNVILDNNFDTALSNDLIAEGDLTINSGKIVSIDATNGYIRVNNKLTNNGEVTIESNGQLVQVNDTDTNDGDYSGTKFTVKRNYTATNIDYVYWSAPTKLFNVSSLPNGYRYQWNPTFANTNGTQGNWVSASGSMSSGKGYIARTFNGSATPITSSFSFTGQPNNGLIPIAISRGSYQGADYDAEPANPNNVLTSRWDDNWNLVGNPYPSAIKALSFLSATDNPDIEGFVYLWTHQTAPTSTTDPFYYNFGYSYTPSDYIAYNGTGTVSGPTGFNGDIASGQGFFVLMKDGPAASGTVNFKNSMRRNTSTDAVYNNAQFYRSSSPMESTVLGEEEKHLIWLDIVTSTGNANRTLVGYVENATNDKDRLYDAITQYSNQLKIYSYLNDVDDQEYCIQGRSLPFNDQDKINIGVSIPSNGTYKIAIAAVNGLFNGSQDIFIEDKLLNVIQSIKSQPYSFTATKGNFTDRFVLRYNDQALGNNDFNNNNQLIITSNNSQIDIISNLETITEVIVYDMLGREIYQNQSLEVLQHTIKNNIRNQALIVKVKLSNGSLVSKKIIVN